MQTGRPDGCPACCVDKWIIFDVPVLLAPIAQEGRDVQVVGVQRGRDGIRCRTADVEQVRQSR